MFEMMLVGVFTFLSFLMGVAQFIFGGIIDKVAESIGVSIAAVGQLTTVYSLTAEIGTPIVMILGARFPRHKLLFFGLINMVLGNALTFTASNFTVLLFARMLVGLGAGVYGINAFSIIADAAKPERRGRDLSMISIGASFALVVGVPFSRIITSLFDWRYIFVGLSLFTLILAIILFFILKSSNTQEPAPLKEQLSYLFKPQTALLFMVTFSMFIGYSIMNTYVTPFLLNLSTDLETIISMVLLGLGISSVIGSRTGGVLADKFGATKTIMMALLVQVISLILVTVLNQMIYVVIPALFIWAISAWTCGPIFNLNINNRFTQGTGILLSINGTMVQFGFAGGAILGGIIVENYGIQMISLLATGMAILAFALFYFESKVNTKH